MKKILFIGAIDPFSEQEIRLQPLWPAYLAAYAEKVLGSEKMEFHFVNRQVEKQIRKIKPDLVAISSISKNYDYAIEYARLAKKHDLPVIVGGMHVTILPHTLTRDMDVGVMGEGEVAFAELLRLFLEKGELRDQDFQALDGIAYWRGDKLCKSEKRNPPIFMDDCPHPNRDLIGYGRRDYVYSTRGCAYNCIFCSCSSHWGTVRYTSPQYVVEEIRELVDHGVKIIRINDENFASNGRRLKKISELVIEGGLHQKVRFSCWCRSNNVTPDIVEALKAMNVVSVKMGLESGSDRTLQYLKGGVTVADNLNAVNLLKDAGIQVNGDFIIGAPDESYEEIMMTYDFIKNTRVDFVDVNILTPLPGTPLWNYALQKGIVRDDMDWRALNFKFLENADNVPIVSEHLSRQQLLQIYKKFQRLRFFKALKAVPHSPWINELPLLALKRMKGKICKLAAMALMWGVTQSRAGS